MANAHLRLGNLEKVVELAQWMLLNEDAIGHHFMACAHAAAGRRDDALAAIVAARAADYEHFASMKDDPDLAPLHGDAEFESLF